MLSSKSTHIRNMFSAIAPRYDFLNHLLSLNFDKRWRREAVAVLKGKLPVGDLLYLDLCCGTGDLSLEMGRQGICSLVGCDFSHSMLRLNREKSQELGVAQHIHLVEANALELPFRFDTFDGVMIAFGLRNLDDPVQGVAEIHRILRPGGKLVVLEFSKPLNPWFNDLFQFYFSRILPGIGKVISKHKNAYSYLPASVRLFPDQQELLRVLQVAGFQETGFLNLSGGIAAIHYGIKQRNHFQV